MAFILRRIVTPTVGGTVMMILSITLASVVFGLLDASSHKEPIKALLTALITLGVVAALALRGSALLRLWGPMIGIVGGCIAAAALGIYNIDRVINAPWIGLPSEWPGLSVDFGIPFWTLLPGFLFLGIIISIQTNGAAIAGQHASRRATERSTSEGFRDRLRAQPRRIFWRAWRERFPTSSIPEARRWRRSPVLHPKTSDTSSDYLDTARVRSKSIGIAQHDPGTRDDGLPDSCHGNPVDGARTAIQTEENSQKVVVAGMCFWIGAAFQFNLFNIHDFGPVWGALFNSGVTTGGFAAVAMILYLELTHPRRMRFRSRLHIDSLPELNDFIAKFARSRNWDDAMKDRLSAVAEETLLTLAPLDLSAMSLDDEKEADEDGKQLIVLAANDGAVADLEFIGGVEEGGQNIEDRVIQLQLHDSDSVVEQGLSLQLLRNYASSVRHQQYHDADIITVKVDPPGS